MLEDSGKTRNFSPLKLMLGSVALGLLLALIEWWVNR